MIRKGGLRAEATSKIRISDLVLGPLEKEPIVWWVW
jgi:hypothetical protein